jgi:hypothetical protein
MLDARLLNEGMSGQGSPRADCQHGADTADNLAISGISPPSDSTDGDPRRERPARAHRTVRSCRLAVTPSPSHEVLLDCARLPRLVANIEPLDCSDRS